NRPVPSWIDELVRMPGGRERPCLRLAVADDACDDEIRIVERGAGRVRERIAELSPFVDRARRFGSDVAGHAAGEGKLLEELAQPGFVARDVRINLRVGSFEVDVPDERRAAVSGARDVNHVEVVLPNDAIQMDVDQILSRRRAPVAEQTRLDVSRLQRL